jgi:hypothetical protein
MGGIVFARILHRNENGVDRTVRVILGVVLLALYFVGPKTPWGLLGLIPLATGLVGSCPLYTILGIGTCPRGA